MASDDDARSIQGASDELITNICGPCNFAGTKKEATHYCQDCDDILCRNCAETHKGHKSFRDHRLQAVHNLASQTTPRKHWAVLCGCSKNNEVDLYCKGHGDVFCQSCKIVNHRKCKTVTIAEKSASFAGSDLNKLIQKAKVIETGLADSCREKIENIDGLAFTVERCRNDINKFRKDIDTLMDLLEERMLKETEDEKVHLKAKLTRHLTKLSTAKNTLQLDTNLLESVHTSAEKFKMFAAFAKVSNRVNEYENLLQDIGGSCKSPKMTFEKNTDLSGICKTISCLGSIKVTFADENDRRLNTFADMLVEYDSKFA